MIYRISVLRCRRAVRMLLAAVAALSCALLELPQSRAATQSSCSGRSLLQCSEITAMYNDSVNWTLSFVRDFELFETRIPVGLHNPALSQFWHFEAASAAARALTETVLGNQDVDPNFEQISSRPALPTPLVKPSGVVNRRLATALTRLMLAEEQEVANLEGAATALNRATAAAIERSRPHWVAWQKSAAADFAIHAAAAIGRVERAQRTATRLLAQRRLLFGVGSADLAAAQRQVRRHGLARSLVSSMRALDVDKILIAYAAKGFVAGSFGAQSFSLTAELSTHSVMSTEKALATSLRHFAARIPSAGRPPA
jgi:hypothetical protein